jgi:hypothetical protein
MQNTHTFEQLLEWLKLSDVDFNKLCQLNHTSGSGPGGQHRNRKKTCVILQHIASQVSTESSGSRYGGENLKDALEKLRILVALNPCQLPEIEITNPELPRFQHSKISERNPQLPLFIAWSLYFLNIKKAEYKSVSEIWGWSSSAFLKQIFQNPLFWNTFLEICSKYDKRAPFPPR